MTFACTPIGQSRAAYLQVTWVNVTNVFGDAGWANPTVNTRFGVGATPTGYPLRYPGGRIEGIYTQGSGTVTLLVTEDPISSNPPLGFDFETLVISGAGSSNATLARSAATAATSGYTRTFTWVTPSLVPGDTKTFTLTG